VTQWTDVAVLPSWWLCGWVDTDSPGYRTVSIGGTPYTAAAGYHRWPDYIGAIDTAVGGGGWAATVNNRGAVRLSGSSAAVVWTDRAGWLMGMGTDPADSEGSVTSVTSRTPPPGCIPLIGANWVSVDRTAESQITVDRWQRGHGYVWGSAELWRWRLRMVRDAVPSFRSGHLLSGKVTLTSTLPDPSWSDSPWSSSNSSGYLDGYVVGVEGGRWLGPTREVYEVDLLVATAVGS